MRGLLVTFSLALAAAVRAADVAYTLTLAHEPVSPDGFSRLGVTVNGITPGPVLTANKGDNMTVLVQNRLNGSNLEHSTSIHWHGILQPGAAYDDGSSFVTQCPIAPGHDYSYKVVLNDQAGTFWYHSQLSSQYIDGLRGALVVYDRDNDPHRSLYDVDDESTIITLTDWYQNSAKQLGEDWIAGKTPEPVPDSNLINGAGRFQGGPPVPRTVINVQPGKRYRFRLINMSAMVPFNFAIEGHELTVIEADGVSHQPIKVSSLSIAAGQRYSFVIATFNAVRNYWIAYPSNFRDFSTVPTVNMHYNGTEAFAILRYEGSPLADPPGGQFVPDYSNVLQEHDLVPLENLFPGPPEEQQPAMVFSFLLVSNQREDIAAPGSGNNLSVNYMQYTSPKIPTLSSILSGATNQSDFPQDTYLIPTARIIDVRLEGNPRHPFHLHGHKFQVIQSATGPRNVVNPPIRDTVDTNVEIGDKAVTIRFIADNPGPWFLHCNQGWHLEAGLGVVFVVDPEEQREKLNPPKAWRDLCDIYNALPDEQDK